MTNRGTAYILFKTPIAAEKAISHMHEGYLDGAQINVSIVLPRRRFSRSPPPRRPPPNRFGEPHRYRDTGPPPAQYGGPRKEVQSRPQEQEPKSKKKLYKEQKQEPAQGEKSVEESTPKKTSFESVKG
ncbi:hypothetical protein CAC42_7178 [Sphaceloma murrayae]|uniref:RRM domain-containing protein n=1 Tax=Sphaceloma murrayae TaxID=2082308 RepID=A0A2K1QPV4_9PEZI|nr:hypothetical protein CAC42_7178 [Sphaceloma murrayae]